MKKIKIITIILAIVLISLVSFVGVYVEEQNIMINKIKDYDLAMNLSEYRQIILSAKDAGDENGYTSDNYNKSKQIIEKRLKAIGVKDYLIRVSEEGGNIVLQIPEDENTDYIVSNISSQGKYEIVDSQTKEVLINNADVKSSNVLSSSTENGAIIYLNIEFTQEGKEKLKNITTEYKTLSEEENTEEKSESSEEDKEETTQPEITMQIDGSEMLTQSFDKPIETGSIQLALNTATSDNNKLQQYIKRGTNIASIIDSGVMPIEFEIEGNEYVNSEINTNVILVFSIIVSIISLIALVILIIKYKLPALLCSISYIGFVAIYLLIIRYANVQISIEGIGGIILVLIINYILISKLLKNGILINSYKEFIIELIPILIAIVVFCFTKWANIASFGMIMFWGVLLTLIYHITVTKTLLKMLADK